MSNINIPSGSEEFLEAPLSADVVLDEQTVQLTIDPDRETWLPAVWIGDPGMTRVARSSDVITWEKGIYEVYGKIGASPQTPIIPCGTVYVW